MTSLTSNILNPTRISANSESDIWDDDTTTLCDLPIEETETDSFAAIIESLDNMALENDENADPSITFTYNYRRNALDFLYEIVQYLRRVADVNLNLPANDPDFEENMVLIVDLLRSHRLDILNREDFS